MTPSLEDLVRRHMLEKGSAQILLVPAGKGRFQCSVQRGRGNAFGVHIDDDPAAALFGALAEHNETQGLVVSAMERSDGVRPARFPAVAPVEIAVAETNSLPDEVEGLL